MTDLAELLRVKRSEIVDRWLGRITREHHGAELSTAELRDHLPRFFNELLDALARREKPMQAASTGIASQHGEQRLRDGFDVDEVVREYDLLGDTILETAREAGIVCTIDEARAVLRLVNAGTAEAVAAYVGQRDRQAQRQADEHVSFVAHELRNPLNTINLALTGLRRTLLSPGGNLVEMLDRSIKRIRELVDQVLMAARFPNLELRMERLAIRDMIAEALREVEAKIEHKQISVTLDIDEGLTVEADRRLLHSVAANLIGNAIKFTAPGGILAIRSSRDGNQLRVEFEDGCGGLPDGSPEDLFQPYVQRGTDRSGLGLGLAIVKQAVEAHLGTIAVTNRPGAGCTFSIGLPVVSSRL